MSMPIANLPRLIAVNQVEDCGPDGCRCPHCDAKDRYITWASAADGQLVGAMAGCLQLFPQSPLLAEHKRATDRIRDYQRQGWRPAVHDLNILAAIEAVGRGEQLEWYAMDVIYDVRRARAAASARRWGRR